MKRAILLLVVLAAGCKHAPQPPEIREVLVPTPVSCVDPAEIPPEPATAMQSTICRYSPRTRGPCVNGARLCAGCSRPA
jgi:hypothetical protein